MMENVENQFSGVIIGIVIIGLLFLVAATMALFLDSFKNSIDTETTSLSSDFIATSLTNDLEAGDGILTFSVKVYNDTWLDFDGENDYFLIDDYNSISFWYKNDSVDWIFVFNASGTLYVNGVEDTPKLYPVYNNGTNLLVGQINETTFFDGSIDDFRAYEGDVNSTIVSSVYSEGRV